MIEKKPIITIGIPQYNENEKEIFPLLSMIDNQVGINFNDIEVIICNDASNVILNENFINSFYNIKPKYLKLEKNSGPGICRQSILDNMNGNYILFCDADDILHNIASIGLYLSLIKEEPEMDIIYTSWLEEIKKEDGSNMYITHRNEATWCFAKLIKKSFIDEVGVKFHPDLRIHEDSYFLGLLFDLTTKKKFIDIVTYLWKYGENSITRKNNCEYSYTSFPIFIKSIMYLIDKLKEIKPEKINYKVVQLLIYIYFNHQLPIWNDEKVKKYKKDCEKELQLLILKYKDILENISSDDFNKIYNDERAKILLPANEIEKENFNLYYMRILNTTY